MFTPEASAPAYRVLADDLRAQILDGVLAPGQRLATEQEMATSYGIGRSTVREALRTLASQRLVVTTRGVAGGTFVNHPATDELADTLAIGLQFLAGTERVAIAELLEARELLEIPAAGLAARRTTPELVARLEAGIPDDRAGEERPPFTVNWTFHETLLEATGNQLLAMMTRPLFGVLATQFHRRDASTTRWDEVDDDHRAILAAVAAGNPDEASAAMRTHLHHLGATYRDLERI